VIDLGPFDRVDRVATGLLRQRLSEPKASGSLSASALR
jgi:hypothetical protein